MRRCAGKQVQLQSCSCWFDWEHGHDFQQSWLTFIEVAQIRFAAIVLLGGVRLPASSQANALRSPAGDDIVVRAGFCSLRLRRSSQFGFLYSSQANARAFV
mmetsp:Transcript_53734/g.135698  ORF Transcript_53734/g.135698 Transcript_53734/m.135698 type:complete len:101 (+) Transcript_53734:2317-2619(+)